MNEVRNVTPGIVARIRSSNFRNASPCDPRFMRARTLRLACCSGISIYFASRGCAASVSSNLCVTRFGYAYKNRTHSKSSTCARRSKSCANPSRKPRSSPYDVVSCPISVISRAPDAARFSASRTTDSKRRLRNFPRSCGIMQNVHGWSQPSAILMYAACRGVVITRGVRSWYRNAGGSAGRMRRSPSTASRMRSTSPVPTTASTSGTCSKIWSRYRSTRQPATINFFAAPNFLCSAISRIASTDSFCAGSMKLHVFTTKISASSARGVNS